MSADRIMVRPGAGRRVRLEDGRVLTPDTTPKEGVSAPRSIYVERRLTCGDLEEVKAEAAPGAPPAPPAKGIADMKGA